jgi:hypothetical protein
VRVTQESSWSLSLGDDSLRLNCFRLEPSTASFTAYERCCPKAATRASCDARSNQDWVLNRNDDHVLGVPLSEKPATPFGERVEIKASVGKARWQQQCGHRPPRSLHATYPRNTETERLAFVPERGRDRLAAHRAAERRG